MQKIKNQINKKAGSIMVDIETLGTGQYPVIVSIAAVAFNRLTGETFEEFYVVINKDSCALNGFNSDAETLFWWYKTGKLPEIIRMVDKSNVDIKTALQSFCDFIEHNSDQNIDTTEIWAKSPEFDLVILKNAIKKVLSQDHPWNFRMHRCVRTAQMYLSELGAEAEFEATDPTDPTEPTHNALEDCKKQIRDIYYDRNHGQSVNNL